MKWFNKQTKCSVQGRDWKLVEKQPMSTEKPGERLLETTLKLLTSEIYKNGQWLETFAQYCTNELHIFSAHELDVD